MSSASASTSTARSRSPTVGWAISLVPRRFSSIGWAAQRTSNSGSSRSSATSAATCRRPPPGHRPAQPAGLLVGGDPPRRERGRGPRVGEHVAGQVRCRGSRRARPARRRPRPTRRSRPARRRPGRARTRASGRVARAGVTTVGATSRTSGVGRRAHRRAHADGAEVDEVTALVVGHPHGVGERHEHLGRRVLVAALLEPHEVVDADPGERGDLLAPQARRAPAAVRRAARRRAARSARGGPGGRRRAAGGSRHRHHHAGPGPRQGGPAGARINAAFRRRRRPRTMAP